MRYVPNAVVVLIAAILGLVAGLILLAIPVRDGPTVTGSVAAVSWTPSKTTRTTAFAVDGKGNVVPVFGNSTSSEKFEAVVDLDGGVTVTASVPKSLFSSLEKGVRVKCVGVENLFGGVIGIEVRTVEAKDWEGK